MNYSNFKIGEIVYAISSIKHNQVFYDEYDNTIIFEFKEYKMQKKEYEKDMEYKYEYLYSFESAAKEKMEKMNNIESIRKDYFKRNHPTFKRSKYSR